MLVHGPLAFDSAARTASVEGNPLDLSARELAVLELLLLRSGRVIAKEQFVEHLCGWDQDVTPNALGSDGVPFLQGRSFSSAELIERRVEPLGADVLIEGYVHRPR